jgi:hypothetical protein
VLKRKRPQTPAEGNTRSKQEPEPVLSSSGRQILRSMVQHEDDLRNQRLGYFLTLNGFLFAALAFAWKTHHAVWLVGTIAIMGMLIAISARASMRLSSSAIRYLRTRGPVELPPGKTIPATDVELALEALSIPVSLSKRHIEAAEQPESSGLSGLLQPWSALPIILLGAWLATLGLGIWLLR